MTKTYYVVAGSYEEFKVWRDEKVQTLIKENSPEALKDLLEFVRFTYVFDVKVLTGVTDPKGYFYGTWRERPDIREVLEYLHIASLGKNQTIKLLLSEVA